MRSLLVEDIINFERGLDPRSVLEIGYRRYLKDAQMYWKFQNSTAFVIGIKYKVKIKKLFWIEFPKISKYEGEIKFLRKVKKGEELYPKWKWFFSEYEDSDTAQIDWKNKKEENFDEKLADYLEEYTVENIEKMMANVIEADNSKYYDFITSSS